MSFPIPANASKSEKMDVINAALQSIADGSSTEVSLHFVEPEVVNNVAKVWKIVRNEQGQVRIPYGSTPEEVRTIMMLAEVEEMEKREAEAKKKYCEACEEEPCVFFVHEASLLAYDEAEHGGLLGEDVPTNNLKRKKLYRQLTLMLNGGPMGAGVRKPLPDCCVAKIREWFSSETYMGYHQE